MVGVMQCLLWQGNGSAHWLVSSRIEPAISSCSTHMYNCRRALEALSKIANTWESFRSFMCPIGNIMWPMTGGPFAVYPNKVKALQLTDHPRGTLSTSSGLFSAKVQSPSP